VLHPSPTRRKPSRFEVSPSEALAFDALIGDSAASNATSTANLWQRLEPEVLWSFEGGLRWSASKFSGGLTFFDSEIFNSIQHRTLIVPTSVVGKIIGGQTIVAQDEEGRIFVEQDPRPVVSRANIGRIRIHGLESSVRVNWTNQWSSVIGASLHRGRELDTGNFARRIAPDNLHASLRWIARSGWFWLAIFTEMSGPQTRLNPAELNDPRIGGFRTRETIANFFNFTARRLGLIENDRLRITGETLDEVIARVLGDNSSGSPLFGRTKGFATLNLRGTYRLDDRNELFFAFTNITDLNYRKHGSGFDASGVNVSISYRVHF
jgi:outer membrane receptor protein involved in Fe transport